MTADFAYESADGEFGLLFGMLCSVPYLFIGGLSTAVSWWIAGIPYDIMHCVGNFVVCLLLFKPLCTVMKKATADLRCDL